MLFVIYLRVPNILHIFSMQRYDLFLKDTLYNVS